MNLYIKRRLISDFKGLIYFLDKTKYLNDCHAQVSVRLQYCAQTLPSTVLTFPSLVLPYGCNRVLDSYRIRQN